MDDVIDKVLDDPKLARDVGRAYASQGRMIFRPNGLYLAAGHDSVDAEYIASELTRLSMENARLRAKLSAAKGASDGR